MPVSRFAATVGASGILAVLLVGCGEDGTTEPDPSGPSGGGTTTERLPVSRDTMVDPATPTTNYATSPNLRVGDGREVYLNFDLADLPPDAVVRSIELCLTATDADADATVAVYAVLDDDWPENLPFADRPESGDLLGSFVVTARVDEAATFAFGSDAAAVFCRDDALNANRAVSFRLTSTAPVHFQAHELGEGAEQPKLSVTYEMGTRVVIEPEADTWLFEGSDTPQGGRDFFMVSRTDSRSLMRFALGAIPGSATILHGTLRTTAFNGYAFGGDGNVYVHFVPDDAWDEATLLWADQPDIEGDSLGHWWLWYDSTPIDRVGQITGGPLLDVLRAEHAGDGRVTFRLHSPGYRTEYRSREYFFASQRPQIEVVYAP